MTRPCPKCREPKNPAHYLCRACWFSLSAAARRALNRRDTIAAQRLLELHRQIRRQVPLAEIVVTP